MTRDFICIRKMVELGEKHALQSKHIILFANGAFYVIIKE